MLSSLYAIYNIILRNLRWLFLLLIVAHMSLIEDMYQKNKILGTVSVFTIVIKALYLLVEESGFQEYMPIQVGSEY